MSIIGIEDAIDKDTDIYGFTAMGERAGISLADSQGGGIYISFSSKADLEDVKNQIAQYIKSQASTIAEALLNDLGLEELAEEEIED